MKSVFKDPCSVLHMNNSNTIAIELKNYQLLLEHDLYYYYI